MYAEIIPFENGERYPTPNVVRQAESKPNSIYPLLPPSPSTGYINEVSNSCDQLMTIMYIIFTVVCNSEILSP